MRQKNGYGEPDDAPLRVYGLRFTDRALAEIDMAHDRLAAFGREDAADSWEKGLFEEIAKLATLPLRHSAPSEAARFRGNVRQLMYRRSSGSACRVLFTVREESLDGPLITVLTVRHGAAKPITRSEAREMEADI
jgi:plasmid stabilization system protein ParE